MTYEEFVHLVLNLDKLLRGAALRRDGNPEASSIGALPEGKREKNEQAGVPKDFRILSLFHQNCRFLGRVRFDFQRR